QLGRRVEAGGAGEAERVQLRYARPGLLPRSLPALGQPGMGADIVGVPYRGGGPIAQELLAGQLQIAKMGVGNFLGLLATGKIKPLAVTSARRSPLLPDVPTFAEAGLPYPGFGWWGLAAPKGTPEPIVAKVNAEFVRVFTDPKFMAFLEKQAVVPAAGSQADFIAFLKQDRRDAEMLVKIANTPKSEYKPN